MVAPVVLVVQTTGGASAVGVAPVARSLPTPLAGPFFGVLADRLDRRAVLVGSDPVGALLAAGLMFARDLRRARRGRSPRALAAGENRA